MNLQSLVVIVLRLMALNFLLRVAVQLTPTMLLAFGLYPHSNIGSSPSVLPWLVLLSLFGCAIVLWFLAFPIARLVTRGVSHDLSFGIMSLPDCYSIAFMAIGLLYIANGLPEVLTWTHYLFKTAASSAGGAWKEDVNWYSVAQALIPFVVGVVLFVNGRGWALALARRHPESEPSGASESSKPEAPA